MSLTIKQLMALLDSSPHSESETSQDERDAFAAGIAHERARCVKVCRDRAAVLEGIDDSHSRARREASINCAAAIEVPAYGGKPKE